MSLYTLIGVMSGTSMDGIDLVCGNFEISDKEHFPHSIQHSETYKYTEEILEKLKQSTKLSPPTLLELDKTLGNYFSDCINDFIDKNGLDTHKIDAIASHGHTIFHQPERGFTYQIGCGDTIATRTGIKVINDFRQKDVIAGGQGAPLVPIGDKLLYGNQAEAFLNIGGFCNISIPGETTIAFDICPGNLPMNFLMGYHKQAYDQDGNYARTGTTNPDQLEELNNLDYYQQSPPKSLGTEWLNEVFMPIADRSDEIFDDLSTIVDHIAHQIGQVCRKHNINSLFITGGGAYNSYLIEKIKESTTADIIIPDPVDIEFKEAIIFGLLGALYLDGRPNTLASVTGAKQDVCGGVLHLP